MSRYESNLRDIYFNLFEVFHSQERMGRGPFEDLDADTAREILEEISRLAEGPIFDSWASTDRNPPVYDPNAKTVSVPEDFKTSYHTWMDSEFWRLDIPTEIGGAGATPMMRWAAAEMILGANPAVYMYGCGPGFASILWELGNDDQKRLAELMIDNKWGSTMILTEPDAGSDVGAGRTKAVQLDDGSWRIEGVKRFITSGEHDMADNIVHLVLARPEGAGPGTKGLSLFAVPKFHVDLATGELGERNGVYATNVEHKMGLKASATCEMTFSQNADEPAIGWLVGDVHNGIAQMFKVIEYARMMVGTKAMSAASTSYINAAEYAKTRVQGNDIRQMGDKSAPKVEIIKHPDVRRSLMMQKAQAEGLRALVMFAAYQQDLIAEAEANGEDTSAHDAMNDLLLPIVKGYGAQRANEMINWSLQIFGGSGFLQDYPLEGWQRDSVIDELYEGVIAIQANDLWFRKILKNQFAAIMQLSEQIASTVKYENGPFLDERKDLGVALDHVQKMMETATTWTLDDANDHEGLYLTAQNTVRLLMATGDLVVGWLLLRQAEIASNALLGDVTDADRGFYTGKIAAAQWFIKNRLPLIEAERNALNATSLSIMDLPDNAW